jgi:hypothetical protein
MKAIDKAKKRDEINDNEEIDAGRNGSEPT